MVTALDALGVDQPAIIGAHSLGTVVALRLAATHPERVARLTAFGPPLYADAESARRKVRSASTMARLFALPGPIARLACQWVCNHREFAAKAAQRFHDELPSQLAADSVQHTWASYSETLQTCLLTGEPATWIDDIRAPVRLVAGDDDPVVDRAFLASVSARAGTSVSLEWWPGDHRLPLTDPDRCRAAIVSSDPKAETPTRHRQPAR